MIFDRILDYQTRNDLRTCNHIDKQGGNPFDFSSLLPHFFHRFQIHQPPVCVRSLQNVRRNLHHWRIMKNQPDHGRIMEIEGEQIDTRNRLAGGIPFDFLLQSGQGMKHRPKFFDTVLE